METVSQEKLDSMLRKVQGLLAKADHPNTPVPEAESARNMAEALMMKYRIDETSAANRGELPGFKPEWRTFVVCNHGSEFVNIYRSMASSIVAHVGARAVTRYIDGNVVCEAVGYASDLRMAEVLYTSAQLAFQTKLEPKYDPSLSEQENAYHMRSAGMEGWRIAEAIYGRTDKALRPKVRAMFKAEAIKRGEDPSILLGKGNSVKLFRESYAKGFEQEIWSRLNRMRSARGAEATGLVLASRDEDVAEAFYEKYPQYRPVKTAGAIGWTDPSKECPKCKAAKSGYCREHSYLKPRAYEAPRVNGAAYRRGVDAAAAADLGPSGVKPKFPTNGSSSGAKELG